MFQCAGLATELLCTTAIVDNVTIRVALKLKLPIGKDAEDAWKAANGAEQQHQPELRNHNSF
jgi:hypothetical protein